MRSAIVWIIAAGLVAAPTAAQQTAPANAAADSAEATTIVEPDSGNVSGNDVIADPLADPAMPAAAPEAAPADVAYESPRPKRSKGFPWGLLGLLGLAGLLSRGRHGAPESDSRTDRPTGSV